MEWLKFWGPIVTIIGAIISVIFYFIRNWKDVETLKAETAAQRSKTQELEAYFKKEIAEVEAYTKQDVTRLEMSLNALTERLLAAIDKNNKETDLKIEKLRSEHSERLAEAERENHRTTQELFNKLEKISLGIVEMRSETKNTHEKLIMHEKMLHEYQQGRVEFYQKFGGYLEMIPKLINGKNNA